MKKKRILILFILMGSTFLLGACTREKKMKEKEFVVSEAPKEESSGEDEQDEYEKGYNLPVDDNDRKAAEADCIYAMGKIKAIYKPYDKGNSINVVISDEIVTKMLEILKETGYPVSYSDSFFPMCNYEKMENFLVESLKGIKGELITYELHSDSSICRRKFTFDGTDMYVLDMVAVWNEENEPVITSSFFNIIKKWRYTKKGWFIFEYCVPEPPEVSEVVNGNAMIRVKPLKEEYRKIAKKYLLPLGYQGNNLLCSNRNANHMEELDYNGLYQYLYSIKHQRPFDYEQYPGGIPKEEFQSLITEYLPITAAKLELYAIFNTESQTYDWVLLGCGNYAPNAFGMSIPEITNMEENEDGTVTLTIDAVCEMLGNDEVMSHKLTVQFLENDNIRYLSNQVLDDGLDRIPAYYYRLGR